MPCMSVSWVFRGKHLVVSLPSLTPQTLRQSDLHSLHQTTQPCIQFLRYCHLYKHGMTTHRSRTEVHSGVGGTAPNGMPNPEVSLDKRRELHYAIHGMAIKRKNINNDEVVDTKY